MCEGVESIQKGLCELENGLVDITEVLDDVLAEREMNKKRRCEALDKISDMCRCIEWDGCAKDC